MKRIRITPIILTLSLAMGPLALNAMELEVVYRPGKISRERVFYYADIIDNKDTQLLPVQQQRREDPFAPCMTKFADYLLNVSANTDFSNQLATAHYSVTRDAAKIAQGTVEFEWGKDEIQRYVRRLNVTAYLRILFFSSQESYQNLLRDVMTGQPTTQGKIRDNNGIELPRINKSDGIQFGAYFLKGKNTRNNETQSTQLSATVTKNDQIIAQIDKEIPFDQLFEQRLDQDATLQIFPFFNSPTPPFYLREYVDITQTNSTSDNNINI